MKNSRFTISLWLVFLLFTNTFFAQRALPPVTPEATDLAKIKSAYNQAGVVSCRTTYQLKAETNDEMTGNLTLSGNDYHFKIAHFEYLQQGERLLYIDHEAHEMYVYKTHKAKGNPTNAGHLATLLDEAGVAANLEELGNGQRKMSIESAALGLQNVDIWYDTRQFFIERIRTVLPQNGAILEVSYQQVTRSKGKFPYSMSAFTQLKNKKYSPTQKYKNYTVRVMS